MFCPRHGRTNEPWIMKFLTLQNIGNSLSHYGLLFGKNDFGVFLVKRELSTEINKIDINIFFIANRLQSTNLSTIERKVAESGGILKFVVDIQQKLARNISSFVTNR